MPDVTTHVLRLMAEFALYRKVLVLSACIEAVSKVSSRLCDTLVLAPNPHAQLVDTLPRRIVDRDWQRKDRHSTASSSSRGFAMFFVLFFVFQSFHCRA